jgi:hypothetical protein
VEIAAVLQSFRSQNGFINQGYNASRLVATLHYHRPLRLLDVLYHVKDWLSTNYHTITQVIYGPGCSTLRLKAEYTSYKLTVTALMVRHLRFMYISQVFLLLSSLSMGVAYVLLVSFPNT